MDLCALLGEIPEPKMRKRSKYRPKPIRLNPVGYVLESLTPMHKTSELMTLKIRNHQALFALTQGKAVREDVEVLIGALNIAEALYRMGFGREYNTVVQDGQQALLNVARRGAATGRFILTGPEMTAINLVMELHDAQLDLCVIQDIEKALAIVQREKISGRAIHIEDKHANNRTAAGDNPTSQTTDHPSTTDADANQERPS